MVGIQERGVEGMGEVGNFQGLAPSPALPEQLSSALGPSYRCSAQLP